MKLTIEALVFATKVLANMAGLALLMATLLAPFAIWILLGLEKVHG